MRIALLLRNVDERNGAGVYAREITRALLRVDAANEYLLVFASGRGLERHGHARARNLVVRAPGKLAWDQLAVPLALRRERVDVAFSAKHSIPLLPFAPRVFVLHGAEWIAYPRDYYALDRLYHDLALPHYLRGADRVITISHDSARCMLTHMPGAGAEALGRAPRRRTRVRPGRGPGPARGGAEGARAAGALRPLRGAGLPAQERGRPPQGAGAAPGPHPAPPRHRRPAEPQGGEDLALVERLGLTDRVRITGWLERGELPAVYSLADAFVFPSLYEGFGIPLLEAMACGCPVVTSTAGAGPEVVGEAELRVDPFSPEAIAAGIARVLSEPDLAAGPRRPRGRRLGSVASQRSGGGASFGLTGRPCPPRVNGPPPSLASRRSCAALIPTPGSLDRRPRRAS